MSTYPSFFFSLGKMKPAVPAHNADIATAAAASLIWGNVARQIDMPKMPASAMSTAIRPVYGVGWNRTIADKAATRRINDVLARIRNSALPAQEYRRLVAMFLEDYHSANSFPSESWAWRQTAERFRLDPTFGWARFWNCVLFYTRMVFGYHLIWGRLPPRKLHVLVEGCPSPQLLRTFWSITRTMDSYPASADCLDPDHTAFTHESLVRTAMAHSKQFASTGKLRVRTANKRHLPRPLAVWAQLRRSRFRGRLIWPLVY